MMVDTSTLCCLSNGASCIICCNYSKSRQVCHLMPRMARESDIPAVKVFISQLANATRARSFHAELDLGQKG